MEHMLQSTARGLLALSLCLLIYPITSAAQEGRAQVESSDDRAKAQMSRTNGARANVGLAEVLAIEERLKVLEQTIERQQREIQALRDLVEGKKLLGRPDEIPTNAAADAVQPLPRPKSGGDPAESPSPTQNQTRDRVDELYKKFGSLTVSGDIRFRAETFANQGFDNPSSTGPRARLRIRARLALDGVLNKNFDWGFRFATGSFTDPISTNQTLTDFFERKPITLDRAFIRFDSKGKDTGVQLVGGRFEPTFRRTQMIWDDDLNVEGASESIYFRTSSALSQLKLVAFQLPFNELSDGKDGVLYGGQAQSDWKLAPGVSSSLNVTYYDWVRADRVVQALGASPFQVNGGITNGAGVSAGQNGSLGTTNRVVRNELGQPVGFLADFNLFNVLTNITWLAKPRVPLMLTFDYVRNLSDRINDEKNGYWVGVQLGQAKERRDWLLGYTYTRIEQDAVLVPFNFSDILASNSRTHIPTAGYQIGSGVTLQWTGLFSQRVNKVFPASPVNRWLNRMQFDLIYKF